MRWRVLPFLVTMGLMLIGIFLPATPAAAASASWPALCSGNAYSTCINAGYTDHGYGGNNSTSYWTMYAGHNCTNYAAYMAINNGAGTPKYNLGVAADWANNATKSGIRVDGTPAVGAIAQYNAYAGESGSSGHVAYVESVAHNNDGSVSSITISEDNYSSGPFRWRKIPVGDSDWPSNFIHFADTSSAPPSSPPWTGVGNATFLGNQLTNGQQMHSNQYIMSPDGRFVLMMESGGNLAEYTAGVTSPIWSTGTGGNSGAWLGVQSDGNVVLYSASGSALWSTGALGITKFVVQDDENVVGYNSAGQAAWNAGKTTNSYGWNWRGSDSLTTGMTMVREQYIRSADGRYITVMQDDGNLVVYGPGQTLLWNSGTPNNPGAYIVVQSDGNVVMYNSAGTTPLWSTGQYNIGRFTIQSNSDLVGYSSVNTTQWVMGSYVGNPWPGVGNATYVGNQLTNGQQLHSNQYIMSNNGWFVLMMQSDGNLVEYNTLGRIWDTATNNNPGAWLGVQSDGNVVIYSASGAALWSTGQQGITKLAVQDDENIVGYNSSGTATWDSGIGTSPLGLTYVSDTLTAGMTLTSGQYLRSADGRYFALMQSDGNFVVYAPGYRELTSTQTGVSAGAYLTVQADGNMVIYASNGTTALWNTGQKGITKLVMQSDGNLVAFNGAGTPVWYTGTTGAT